MGQEGWDVQNTVGAERDVYRRKMDVLALPLGICSGFERVDLYDDRECE